MPADRTVFLVHNARVRLFCHRIGPQTDTEL
jgi:hypothetical protein